MNYKVKKETSNFKLLSEDELIEDLLKARGVEDTKAFLNAEDFPLHDGMKLKNMDRALKCLDYHIKNKSKIHIIADCDCFSGDTKVKMLDGTSKTFEQLEKMEKENPGREYWLYACDEQGKFHPAKGYFPHIASYHEEICVVTLDNGSQIKSTRDHRFMLRDGSYCKAEELKKGASLMPLYWEYRTIGSASDNKYEFIFNNDYFNNGASRGYRETFHSVWEEYNGEKPKGYHIHHKDFDHNNNEPNNLTLLSNEEHARVHGKTNYLVTKYNGSEKQKEDVKRGWELGHYQAVVNRIKNYNKTEANRTSTVNLNKNQDVIVLQQRGKMAKCGKKILELGYELTEENIKNKPFHKDKRWERNKAGKPVQSPSLKNILKYFNNFEEFVEASKNYNHKVVKVDIVKLNKAIPMYDISVDKYHNFAIDLGDNSGIYVHNCDGITSCAFMYNYLKSIDNNLKITFSMNKGKVHGIVLEELENYKFDLLIAPDCGTNDCKACTKLYNDGKDIIILDHHIIQKNNINAIVVNNQDGIYANPTLSGAGVCYKFAKQYDRIHGLNYADNFLDLVALGILGDMSDIRNTETRRLVLEGIKNVKNNFFKEMLLKQGVIEEIKDSVSVTIQDMCFKLSPPLNAVVRVGADEERRDVLKALLGFDETREYKPRKTKNNPEPETETQTLQKAMAREVINIKGRQNRLVEKRVKDIEKKIEEEGLTDDKIIVVDATSILTESTFTGLIANKLAKKYKRPVLLLREFDEDNFGGSGRNYDLSPISNLNKFISEEGLAEGKGHSNAFGVSMKKENVLPLIEYSNMKLKNTKIEDVYWVDYEIALPYLKEKDALKVAKLAPIFGGNVEAPSFAITGVRLKPDDIQLIGKNRNVIKINKEINSQNFTFIKFFANEEEYNKLIGKSNGFSKNSKKEVILDIIAEFDINVFAGKKYLQILIKDYNITQNNKKEIKF